MTTLSGFSILFLHCTKQTETSFFYSQVFEDRRNYLESLLEDERDGVLILGATLVTVPPRVLAEEQWAELRRPAREKTSRASDGQSRIFIAHS
ncbi:MAG TPA: hypothetical protein VGG80_07150 [Acidobacteriaceae bacterium]